MKSIDFLFGIHCHQPVGNFDHVFRQSFNDCYLPLIKTLKKHPKIRFALHYSGPLIEWLEANEKSYLDTVGEMVQKKQVEMMGGGFYEPILAVIPHKDALGQLNMMSDYLESRFGERPRGVWLTERIWEPQLASLLCEAGIEYTNIDDAHFTYSGLTAEEMFGYYVTEDNGSILRVFPTDKTLRYTIPFKLPEVTIDYLRSVSDESGIKSVTIGDDGEKFGVWPGTHKWVYTDGYLDNMCKALEENEEWIRIKTFSEYLDEVPPMGRVYLPTASYEEMMEWALPTSSVKGYEDFVHYLKNNNTYDGNKPYIRGGFWRNFMAKYPESNLMHKKMLRVSKKVHSAEKPNKEALREVWRAQCNCAYWHGLFGGLYLNYLRHAIYNHLINAENIIDSDGTKPKYPKVEFTDHDMDGVDEFIIETESMNCYISPNSGGSIIELDYKPGCFNLSNCLCRREEAYHQKIREADNQSKNEEGGELKSAHDIIHMKEADLDRFLCYDRNSRYSFIDHILPAGTTVDDFMVSQYEEIGDFAEAPFQIRKGEKKKGKITLDLERTGIVQINETVNTLKMEKRYTVKNTNAVEIKYKLTSLAGQDMEVKFATELNFTMLAGDSDDRYYAISGRRLSDRKLCSVGAETDVSKLQMVDEWSNISVTIEPLKQCEIWRFPVNTVSQSEGGFEKNYQNSCILLVKNIKLNKGSAFEFGCTITLGPHRDKQKK